MLTTLITPAITPITPIAPIAPIANDTHAHSRQLSLRECYFSALVGSGGPLTKVGSVVGYGVSSTRGMSGSMIVVVWVAPTKAASSPMHWLASAWS